MSATSRFHELTVSRIDPEAARAVAITLDVPPALRERFAFQPGQFLTLRATINGTDVRRSYSICSTPSVLAQHGQLQVGIRAVDGGVFSTWATTQLGVGTTLSVMPPEGRFTIHRPRALHRVGFAAGSGITPILSIMASSMQAQPETKFTLVYGNRRMDSVMFNEALQDLKDRYPSRLTLIHILSRQAQEVPLLEGRIDGDKVHAIIQAFLPVKSMDEVFVCGPEAMIDATEAALLQAGVPAKHVHTERFTSSTPAAPRASTTPTDATPKHAIELRIVLDGKTHDLAMQPHEHVLDVALNAGLDLPYSCKGGVCCTCRAKVMEGSVAMSKNFTLEPWEMQQGFVLSCQACPTSDTLVVSFDER
ncbi:1,2-phenylacetyl-CoA epoxidase subunit PaaE [Limnohabitans sp. JirII-31]|uniref:1,2-phenylacetyl-CoA epoxidase subunit PaaE n=1 Tax=Limnohabitans sp. JirII-31 TaxID=1977908 RepID=UPI000C1E4977|nr:1,2-phenylacetyl-CoA epoxidase subunit PaaE [Limnohabitans sp. JirII-31]PIT76022.1 phenylacetic acid degradation protein [Limnohabitans sp. JirII-31]